MNKNELNYSVELCFFATDNLNDKIIFKNNTDEVLDRDKDGYLTLVCFIIDTKNINNFFEFILKYSDVVSLLLDNQIIDLSECKINCITNEYLENNYLKWIKISGRENSMDEFGAIQEVINYIMRNNDKKYLFLKMEEK